MLIRSFPRLSSNLPPPHALCGFLAGLHSHGSDAVYSSFSSAYSAVTQIPVESINEFEEEIWQSQSRRFIYGSKSLSVVDTLNDPSNPETSDVTRQLIINTRPNLVQTAITVPSVNAPYNPTSPNPPPISQSHLGGLALALPLFDFCSSSSSTSPPRVHIIGAGGCSLPVTLSFFTPNVTAVEPDSSIVSVAKKYFGADSSRFSLVNSDGSTYLSSLPPDSIDVLIIDADDGSAPPLSMREASFYDELLRSLSPSSVIAINVIDNEPAITSISSTISASLSSSHTVAVVTPHPSADVDERHKLLFAYPNQTSGALENLNLSNYDGLLDAPSTWLRAMIDAQPRIHQ